MKLVVRLLDPDGCLLGWNEVQGILPGDGTIRTRAPVAVLIERQGVVKWVSIHWAEANIEVRVSYTHETRSDTVLIEADVGTLITLDWTREPVIRLGTPPKDLPMVTTHSQVTVAPKAGGVGVTH